MKIGPEMRYSRNFNTLDPEEQALLGKSRVAVVGLGGLGGGVCELLARIGVGRLTLIDGDRFDISNLNRQLLSQEDNLGRSKAKEAKKRVNQINSSVKAFACPVFATQDNIRDLIQGAGLVVDCLDTIPARFDLQDASRDLNIPLVSGAIAGVSGQVTVIFPDDPGFELIYGSRSRSLDGDRGIETRTGNLAHCAMFIAALQVSETVKVLLGRGDALRKKLLIADLWTNSIEVMELI